MYVPLTLHATSLLTTFPDKRGNLILIIICGANFVIYFFTYFFYRGINRYRDQQWNEMTVTVCQNSFKYDQPNSFNRNEKRTWRQQKTKETRG